MDIILTWAVRIGFLYVAFLLGGIFALHEFVRLAP